MDISSIEVPQLLAVAAACLVIAGVVAELNKAQFASVPLGTAGVLALVAYLLK